MSSKFLAPVAITAAMLGLVGGAAYAGSVAFAPVQKPAKVELVQPAAQVATPTVDPAIAKAKAAAAAKAKAAKAAKVAAQAKAKKAAAAKKAAVKVVKVESVQAPSQKAATVQRQATVTEPTTATPQVPVMIKKRDDVVPGVEPTQGPVVIGDPNAAPPAPPLKK